VDINRLNELLTDPSLSKKEDYQTLKQLADEYPYAQFLKILLAKIAQILNEDDQAIMLHSAAIYSADRKVLKKLYTQKNFQYVFGQEQITIDDQTVVFPEKYMDQATGETENPETATADAPTQGEPEQEDEAILDEVLENLNKLKDLRKKYDQPESDGSEIESGESNAPATELDKEEDPPVYRESEVPQDDTPPHQPSDYQKQLIDDFISKLNKERRETLLPASTEKVNEDLSSQSTSFDGDLVTETLAKLCIKQGKIDKAIEIYRKLIWKFPQKKAYFAARIEELNG
jgi:tetratricopeptide (TPR) repeat protein